MIGKLKKIPIRDVWEHEAYDFSTWLFDNCDILSEQIGFTISPIEKEKTIGPFKVDIIGEDLNGNVVIVENQLEKTDHDHLGKIITYLANLDAKIAIWVSTNPRPEHVEAINYLNEIVPQDTHFYLLRLQAFRIGNSDPAPLFTIEAGPSEERTAGGEAKKEFAERDKERYDFFEQLLNQVNQVTTIFNNVSPIGYQNWISAGSGKSGILWTFVVMKKLSRVEFFFCHQNIEVNQDRFNKLLRKKEEIEEVFGEELEWDFNVSRKQQYLRTVCPLGGLDKRENWSDIQKDLVKRFLRLEKAIRPYFKELG